MCRKHWVVLTHPLKIRSALIPIIYGWTKKKKRIFLHIYTEALRISTMWCSGGDFSTYANFLSCPEVRCRLFGPAESGGILINVKRSAWHCCSFTHPQGACSDFNHQPRRNHPQTNRGEKTSWTIEFVMDAFSFGSAQSTWPPPWTQRRIKLPVADYFIGFLLPESVAIPNRIVRA